MTNPAPRFAHQQRNLDNTKDLPIWALWWEQGCVDSETEYLSPRGWKFISEYQGGPVAQWDPLGRLVTFVNPKAYVKASCEKMVRIHGKYLPDQLVSFDHRVPTNVRRNERIRDVLGKDLLDLPDTVWRSIPGSFNYQGGPGTGWSPELLRVLVATMADGHYRSNAKQVFMCYVRLKKERKKERMEQLLHAANIPFVRKEIEDGFSLFKFHMAEPLKRYDKRFWNASKDELKIICEECIEWDGTKRNSGGVVFFSRHKSDVDFIQFAFGALGHVTFSKKDPNCWSVRVRSNRTTNNFVMRRRNVSVEPSTDGFMYCFEVPSSYILVRRRGHVYPTGNTAKTRPVIEIAAYNYDVRRIDTLIVVTDNGLHENWVTNEIPEWMPAHIKWKAHVYHSKKAKTKIHKKSVDDTLGFRGLAILTISWEACMTDTGKQTLWNFLSRRPIGAFMAFDESIACKNPSSIRTKVLWKAGVHAKMRRVLNGTPVDKSPLDIYAQVKLLDAEFWKRELGIRNYTVFKSEFAVIVNCKMDEGHTFEKIVEFKNLDKLTAALAKISDRVLKEDVFDLPPKVYKWAHFDMSDEQWRIYRKFKEECLADIGPEGPCSDCGSSGVMAVGGDEFDCPFCAGMGTRRIGTMSTTNAGVKLLRLQQIACGYQIADNEPIEDIPGPNKRLERLSKVFDQGGAPHIVMSRFQRDVEKIEGLCHDHGLRIGTIYGPTSQEERLRVRLAFQAGELDVLNASQAIVAKGYTLTRAKTMTFYTNLYRLMMRAQAEDRVHRAGLEHSVLYNDIACIGTTDTHVIQNLKQKREIAALVTGDKLREWLV